MLICAEFFSERRDGRRTSELRSSGLGIGYSSTCRGGMWTAQGASSEMMRRRRSDADSMVRMGDRAWPSGDAENGAVIGHITHHNRTRADDAR